MCNSETIYLRTIPQGWQPLTKIIIQAIEKFTQMNLFPSIALLTGSQTYLKNLLKKLYNYFKFEEFVTGPSFILEQCYFIGIKSELNRIEF